MLFVDLHFKQYITDNNWWVSSAAGRGRGRGTGGRGRGFTSNGPIHATSGVA